MLSGILSPEFLQAACAHKHNQGDYLTFTPIQNVSFIPAFKVDTDCEIEHTVSGEIVKTAIQAGSYNFYNLSADANTEIKITGKVSELRLTGQGPDVTVSYIDVSHMPSLTKLWFKGTQLTTFDPSANTALTDFACGGCTGLTALDLSANTALTSFNCYGCTGLTALDLSANTALSRLFCDGCTGLTALDLSANTALTEISCTGCTGLSALDLSANTALTDFACGGCTGLTALDLSANTALSRLFCYGCTGLTALDLSANTALTEISCTGCTGLTEIKYPATNSSVSTSIADAITNADDADGTVYTDSAGAYYSTIATAATGKGWTISQL